MNRILALLLLAQVSCSSDTLRPESDFANKCAHPRTGVDPQTNKAYADVQGTLDDEKSFLYSWIGDLYLWYREVPNSPPQFYATAIDYFNVLKTPATTPSGKPKDQFHFTFDTAAWEALSQSGVTASYGIQWVVIASKPPRDVEVLAVEPGSPAASAGIDRGAKLVSVDGVDMINADSTDDVAKLNAGAFPATAGETHTLGLLDPGTTTPHTVTLTSVNIVEAPVQNVMVIPTATGPVGYMLFKDHIATAEMGLVAAINQLKQAGVTDLVLDIRYNGGGYLAIASELAYMIAGPTATSGKTFEMLTFNDKHPSTDPVTGQPLTPTPFFDKTLGFSTAGGQPLPYLALPRVFIITGAGTCSASESVMNSLRGVDVQVIQIGATTCGKPYGFYPQDDCGTTYFAIQFQGVNNKGFGDYADGFTPGGTGPAGLPGCAVPDDLGHALGDPGEARLAAALAYRASGSCPAATTVARAKEGVVVKSPWHQNRIMDRMWNP